MPCCERPAKQRSMSSSMNSGQSAGWLWQDADLCASVLVRIHGLYAAQGADLSMYDESFLRESITKRVLACGLTSVAAYAGHLLANPLEADEFHRSLHITHSEFFRNSLTFALLEQQILPSLILTKAQADQGEIRVWSAACAAGQEAWSVAMQLEELTRAGESPAAYRIFASDLSEADLAMARAGVYGAKALGNVGLRRVSTYFSRRGEYYEIAPRLRERVDFSLYDLLDEGSSSPEASIYGDFDLIFCCNLLFYYRLDIQQQVLDKVRRALSPGGYLVTGEAEREIVAQQHGLRAVVPSALVFQKL